MDNINIHTADVQHLPACKEELSTEQQERSPSLVPERPQIKEEHEELLQKPEQAAGSPLMLPAVESEEVMEDDDNNGDNRQQQSWDGPSDGCCELCIACFECCKDRDALTMHMNPSETSPLADLCISCFECCFGSEN